MSYTEFWSKKVLITDLNLPSAAPFLSPIFIAGPVIEGFERSPIAIVILSAVYILLIFITKKRKYDPVKFAENIGAVSRELN